MVDLIVLVDALEMFGSFAGREDGDQLPGMLVGIEINGRLFRDFLPFARSAVLLIIFADAHAPGLMIGGNHQ